MSEEVAVKAITILPATNGFVVQFSIEQGSQTVICNTSEELLEALKGVIGE